MFKFIIIVESSSDAQIATKLAERALLEKVDWLESELLPSLFQGSGLHVGTEYTCWKDIKNIMNSAKASGLRFLGHKKSGPQKADSAATRKILNFIRVLQAKNIQQIRAVVFIRDLDNQPERREGIEQARAKHIKQQPKLEIIIGTANRMREAWVVLWGSG